jgi:hypothetical protein
MYTVPGSIPRDHYYRMDSRRLAIRQATCRSTKGEGHGIPRCSLLRGLEVMSYGLKERIKIDKINNSLILARASE